ncbi:ankyrin repeat protein [Grosmannia clavigera kw1407]|uniref:Ankyrin repeat protein n=1 Tax=Grosmannia clavigera (strain kw1407 / UAMH 11150) TaxID=655863 RepID=F0XRW7_GROCL|nr:ankyrin repeat protein [Grosmannia clavigera kw1407]EFW99552.1 ankyrin repeat protein [Grosmannia clavigera kw1407]
MDISNIYKDALCGKLNNEKLKHYLALGEDINGKNTGIALTPLMAAVVHSRHKVVKLLVDNEAETHTASAAGQTALWLAASKTNKHRKEIVQLLLDAPQFRTEDLNKIPTNSGDGNTPVMEAVQRGDEVIVRMLVDAGADLTVANREGKRAKDLAEERKDKKLLIALLPAAERHNHHLPMIDRIAKFLRWIIFWVNVSGLVAGVLNAIFGLTGCQNSTKEADTPAPSGPGDCKTVEEFKNYANESGLERFFPRDDQFLHRLVDGIAAFKDSPSPLNTPERIDGLVKLALFQPILFCDDSTSMKGPTSAASTVSRIEALRDVVERITRICNLLTPDDNGTVIRFINQKVTWGPMNADQVREKMRDVVPRGGTRIGTNLLSKVLKPFVYEQIDAGEKAGSGIYLNRPYLICIITDGCPTDGTLFAESMQTLVSFVVCQIGDDPGATAFLRTLMEKKNEFGDSVYVCKGTNNDDLEIRLFNILATPLMR